MSTEITRLAAGTRVARTAAPHIRGTVRGYVGRQLSVNVDDGGSHTGPAHHHTWRELTPVEAAAEAVQAAQYLADEQQAAKARLLGDAHTVATQQAAQQLAELSEGKRRSYAVCPVCGFTGGDHSDGCAAQQLAAEQAAAAALPAPDSLRAAAQQLAAGALALGERAVIGCTCGGSRAVGAVQVLTRYDLDGTGRLREPVLWGVVRVLEHVMATPSLSRHTIRVQVAR